MSGSRGGTQLCFLDRAGDGWRSVKSFLRFFLTLGRVTAFLGIFPDVFAQDLNPELVSRTGGGVAWKNLTELTVAATSGNPEACAQLGEQLLRGDRTPKDGARGLALLEQAARAGVGAAAFRIGMLLDDGEDVSRDRVRALAYFRAAAAGAVAEGYHNVGAAYAGAHGVKRDYVEALGWLILAKKNGVGKDSEEAVRARILKLKRPEWIAAGEERAVAIERELSSASVASYLPPPAPLVYTGSGATGGDAPLALNPVRAASTTAIQTSPEKPLKFVSPTGRSLSWSSLQTLEQAADRNEPVALAALAQILIEGKLAPENISRAVTLLERAAAAGNIDAAQQLADLYTNGSKLPADAAKAFRYNLLAARGGSRQAMYNTGALFTNGLGTERNHIEALAWLTVAKQHGLDPGAEKRLRDFLSKTRPGEIAAAEKRAAELQREIAAAKTSSP
jgi:TPR repeat protein